MKRLLLAVAIWLLPSVGAAYQSNQTIGNLSLTGQLSFAGASAAANAAASLAALGAVSSSALSAETTRAEAAESSAAAQAAAADALATAAMPNTQAALTALGGLTQSGSFTVGHCPVIASTSGAIGDNGAPCGSGAVSSVAGYSGSSVTAAQLATAAANQDYSASEVIAAYGTALRAEAAVASDVGLNILAYGGQGDLVSIASGVMTAGSATLTDSIAHFSSADVGKPIDVTGAGTNGHTLTTTISAYNSGTSVTLATNASASVNSTNQFLASAIIVTGGTGCVPNDLVPLSGGTATITAAVRIIKCNVVSAAYVPADPGSGGSYTNGVCIVTGTTGTGRYFRASVTLSGGAITGVVSVWEPGDYTANPSAIANEPVTGCGLSGAELALTMGASVISPVQIANGTPGDYSAIPSNPVSQGTATGGETGITLTALWNNGGTISYGTDNAPYISAAVAKANSLYASNANGPHPCFYFPQDSRYPYGVGYFVRGSVTAMANTLPFCVVGQASDHTNIKLSAAFSGAFMQSDDAWFGANNAVAYPKTGASPIGQSSVGDYIRGITIWGDDDAASEQDAFVMYDHTTNMVSIDFTCRYLAGSCLSGGVDKNDNTSYFDESTFLNTQILDGGTPYVQPLVDTASGTVAPNSDNELNFTDTSILRCVGQCMLINNPTSATNSSLIRFFNLRTENSMDGDDLDVVNGAVYGMDIYGFDGEHGSINHPEIRFTGPSLIDSPHNIDIFGYAETANGFGVSVDAGRDIFLTLSIMESTGPFLQVAGSNLVNSEIYLSSGSNLSTITTQIDPSSVNYIAQPTLQQGDPAVTSNIIGTGNTGQKVGDNGLCIDCSFNSPRVFLTGTNTTDYGTVAQRCYAGYEINFVQGSAEICDLDLIGLDNTLSTSIPITANGGPASTVNVPIPPNNGLISGQMRCAALDINSGAAALWLAPNMTIQKTGTAPSSAQLLVNGLVLFYPTSPTGEVAQWSLIAAADTTTTGGIVITFTNGSQVNPLIHVSCAYSPILELK